MPDKLSITITPTDKLTELDGIPCRVWEGMTNGGVHCLVFIHRVAVAPEEDSLAFDQTLQAQLPPGRSVSLRHIL